MLVSVKYIKGWNRIKKETCRVKYKTVEAIISPFSFRITHQWEIFNGLLDKGCASIYKFSMIYPKDKNVLMNSAAGNTELIKGAQ